MVKWSIRDRLGKLSETKELKPEMREMLLRLDGVYQERSGDPEPATAVDTPPDVDRPARDQ